MLEVQNLAKRFDGVVAVDDVSFVIKPETILGMIGPNGAGKTVTMNCINGLYRTNSGQVFFEGKEITGRTPHEIAHLGIGRTFQVPRIFHRMSLLDNLMIPVLRSAESDDQLMERASSYLEKFDLYELRHNHGEEISGGQQKLLELARSMMLNPKLILLDEPFAGVNPSLCRILIQRIEELVTQGVTFLLVSHDLTSIYRLSNEIIVLSQGKVIAQGSVSHVKSHPAVIEAYLGNN
jgi:branched-chain amino acid transport system ATP-binding protein